MSVLPDEVITEYTRVIPRDLFNEAKLLKCYGRLSLLVLDGFVPHGLTLWHDGEAFDVRQRQSDGGLVVVNVRVEMHGVPLRLYARYNSRENWPLVCESGLADDRFELSQEISVFDSQGEFDPDFEEFLTRIRPWVETPRLPGSKGGVL